MNRDEFDRLLSEYSTGLISEEDKNQLFQEALQDQLLFEALADEEHLKGVLTDSAFRQELLTSLTPGRSSFVQWFRPWQLALGGTLASALIGTFIAWKTQAPSQQKTLQTPAVASAPLPDTPKKEDTVAQEQPQPLPPSSATTQSEPQPESQVSDAPVEVAQAPHNHDLRTFSTARARINVPFQTNLSEGKLTIEIQQDGLLYVLATEEGTTKVLENGSAAIAGSSIVLNVESGNRIFIQIAQEKIDYPTPAKLRLSGPVQSITVP